ncbi:MAG: YtxH domain-containing protein [Acidimicrobiia bacterium]
MRFRIGLVVGGVVGYVLGARAGRERYEQIKRWAARARKHPAVSQLVDEGLGLVDAGRYMAAAGLSAGARGLKTLDAHGADLSSDRSPRSADAHLG